MFSIVLVCILQSEFIQLCKTLYTLLQDFPEKNELFHAMGIVASNLLREGERNIKGSFASNVQTSEEATVPSTAEISCVDDDMGSDSEKNKIEPISTDKKLLLSDKPNSRMLPDLQILKLSDDQELADLGADEHEHSNIKGPSQEAHQCITKSLGSSSTSSLSNSLTLDVGNDSEVQEKWFLTFEQFVSGLNQEPDLCQFFAEQNLLDLTGASSVDPILSSYTRTVIATSPL